MSTSANNGIYNFGDGPASTATDRAIGGISATAGSFSVNMFLWLKNTGSSPITEFTISYKVEKYRHGSNTSPFQIQMYSATTNILINYVTGGAAFNTSFPPDADNNGYANAPGDSSLIVNHVLTKTVAPGGFLYLEWNYSVASGNNTSNAQALGIDDVVIVAGPCTKPTVQASNLNCATPGSNDINLQWTNGNGNGRYVVINTVNSFTYPVDGVAPATANPVYAGAGEQVVYSGTGNTVNVTGLEPCRPYWFRVFEYGCSGAYSKYDTASSVLNPVSISTNSTLVPIAYNITGATSYCSGTSGVAIGVDNSEDNTNYQLYMDCGTGPVAVGAPVEGSSGSPVTFGNQTINPPGPCTFTVVATNISYTFCSTPMNNPLTVTELQTPNFTVTAHNPTTCNGTEGNLTLTNLVPNTTYTIGYKLNTVANGPFTLNSDGSGTIIISPLGAGSYTDVYATLAGCTFTLPGPFPLSDPLAPTAPGVTASASLICQGDQVILTANSCSGDVTWNNGMTGTPVTVSPMMDTVYTATCTNPVTNCTSSNSLSLNITVKPTPVVLSTDTTCPSSCASHDGQIILTLSIPGVSYQVTYTRAGTVTGPFIRPCSAAGILILDTLGGGTYTNITVTYNGCNSIPFSLTLATPGAPPPPTINGPSYNSICEGSPITLTASNCSGSITWNGTTVGNPITVSPNITSYYTATCTVGGCVSAASSIDTVNVFPKPATPTISAYATTLCSGLADTLTIGGCTGTPVWSTNSNNTSITVTPPSSTTYWVACKSSDNCNSDTAYQAITVKPSPTYTGISPHETTSCGSSTGYFTIEGLPAAFTYYSIDYTDINGNPVHDSIRTNGSNELIVNNLPAGTYANIAVSKGGCSSISTSTSISDPNPPAKPGITAVSQSICLGETIRLNASGCTGGTITWSPTFQTGSFIDVSPNDTTTYFAQCTDATGCKSPKSDDFILIVKPLPAIISIDTTGAINGQNGSAVISIVNSGFRPLSYSWDNPGSWVLSDSSHTGLTSGTHYIKVKDQNGCIDSTSYQINFIPASSVYLSADSSAACPGDIITLNMIGSSFTAVKGVHICISYDDQLAEYVNVTNVATEFANYQVDHSASGKIDFFDNITNPITILDGDTLFSISFRGLTSGTQHITLENFKPGICGVSDISGNALNVQMQNQGTLNFLASPDPTIAGNTEVCIGSPVALTASDNTATNVWTLPDGTSLTQSAINVASSTNADAGKYVLEVTNSLTCQAKDSVTVVIHPLPAVEIQPASPSKILCVESVPSMTPGSSYTAYNWPLQNNSTDAVMPNKGEGTYIVIVTDQYGCQGSDTLSLVSCPAALYIPSAFSPNNDTRNDKFMVMYTDVSTGLDNFKMYIYNRWGQLVYEGSTINAAWDGNFKGKECPAGVYTYVISFDKPVGKTFSQSSPIRGTVTLVK